MTGGSSTPRLFASIIRALEYWVARSSRAMTAERKSAISRHDAPEFCNLTPPKDEDAGKTGCALHPRSRVQMHIKNTHTSIQVQRRQSGLPCAMALRLISCSPRRPGLFATVTNELLRQLDASVGASGPHDFAVRISVARLATLTRPPHPAPTSVTMANAPLEGRDGEE